jgi:hypothetical protein
MCGHYCLTSQNDVSRQRSLDVDDVEVVGEVDAVFAEEPVVADRLQGLIAEGLELEVFELAAFDGSLDVVVIVDVLVLDTEEEVLETDN